MTVEKLKTAVANINAYLSESPGDDDTVTLTAKVIRSIKENYEELLEAKAKIKSLEQNIEALAICKKDLPQKTTNAIKAEAVKEFVSGFDNVLAEMREEYHYSGSETYSAVCEIVRRRLKKYAEKAGANNG